MTGTVPGADRVAVRGALLRLAVPGRDAGWEPEPGLDPLSLADAAAAEGVEYTILQALLDPDRAATLGLTPAVRGRLEVRRRERIRADLSWEVAATLTLAHLPEGLPPPILLKGSGTRSVLYPSPVFRPCLDLDLMVPEPALEEVCSALRDAGWDDETPRRSRRWHVHALIRSRDPRPLSLELHRTLDNPERSRIGYRELAPLCAAHPLLGRECLVPGPEGQLLCAAVHALKHGLDLPLKNLVDVHLAAGRVQGPVEDRGPAGSLLAKAPGLGAAVSLLLELSHRCFGTSLASTRPGRDPLRTAVLRRLLDPAAPGFLRRPLTARGRARTLAVQALLHGSPRVLLRGAVQALLRRLEG